MSTKFRFWNSSVGQKLVVGLTGLFLCTFLVVHLTGNFLLFKTDGGKAFNAYSEFMSTNLGIRTMELGLAAGFLFHIILGIRTWLHNRSARPSSYAVNRASENSALPSRWMFVTGSIVFIFLVIHLYTFFLPTRILGDESATMFDRVVAAFSNPVYSVFYLVALFLLGLHLQHGFESASQTFGLRPYWLKLIRLVAVIFWLLIPLGFASMPLYFLLFAKGSH